MKKSLWFSVLIASLCVLSFMFIYGCGSNPTGGGGNDTTYSGRLVDPPVSQAIVLVDVNGNGIYDTLVTGEQIATTDANGYFTLSTPASIGATVRILLQGFHLGATYDAYLKRRVDGPGTLNMTPLTTMLSNGITAESIQYLLHTYASIEVNAADVTGDPLENFNIADSRSIGKLRGAICTYCLMQIINDATSTTDAYFDLASIEGIPAFNDGLKEMGMAVRSALPDNMVDMINMMITSIESKVNDKLSGSPIHATIPPATVDDVSSTAFIIAKWIMKHSIAAKPTYDPGLTALASIELYAKKIGMREYLLRNRAAVIFTVPSGAPFPAGNYTYETIINNNWMPEPDGGGNIVTGEVAASVKGYDISFPTFDPTIIKL